VSRPIKAEEIRARFLKFFSERGHEIVSSSSLVPAGDPTLLFTNAGMVQFKNVFLGNEQRAYSRAASSQKCVRAGGKHNDLENVGRTARHHTFFEMLGNFSFGDYSKSEAIRYAWAFLTGDLGIDPDRLFVTVYEKDDEAADIWLNEIGVPASQFARIGAKDNFWSMGDTGPCGPCSEIFYDHGPEIPGGPPGSPDEEGDRFVELWNLVFMQFDQAADGSRSALPRLCVDTGMGLERTAAVMQGVHNNYDIDLFQNLIAAASDVTGVKYGSGEQSDVSLRVIADHLRSVCFLLADGVLPSNEGRGFVLRRILRRALRHGRLLGVQEAFMHRLVPSMVAEMGGYFRELKEQETSIRDVVRVEEERFIKTLDKGLKLLDQAVAKAGDGGEISGNTLFVLYDTYGFPVDLTADILNGRDIRLDLAGFEKCMREQKERARAAWSGSGEQAVPKAVFSLRERHGPTDFLGYTDLEAKGVISGLIRNGRKVLKLDKGERGWLVANQTPFYGESGGQTGDKGLIRTDTGIFRVEDTKKPLMNLHVHIGVVESGTIETGSIGNFSVDAERRQDIRRNHTGTHLLQAVLRNVLGNHVRQAGSLVSPDRLRFDFHHFQPLTDDEKTRIEVEVNAAIFGNDKVVTKLMRPEDAIASGAMALFGEKYGDEVRVVHAGPSTELCGGTHVSQLGDIGMIHIMAESGVAAGIRRIEAVTGSRALTVLLNDSGKLRLAAQRLQSAPNDVPDKIDQLQSRLHQAERELQKLKSRQVSSLLDTLVAQAVGVADTKLLAVELPPGQDSASLRDSLDKCKAKLKSGIIVLAVRGDKKVQLIAGVTDDLTGRFHAGKIVNEIAVQLGGRGGGRPGMAQAGGTMPTKLKEVLAKVPKIIEQLNQNS